MGGDVPVVVAAPGGRQRRGTVLQHRGREEEVRHTANWIHGARRSGSLRRGGFSSGDFDSDVVAAPR
jgi:hypothetical protein